MTCTRSSGDVDHQSLSFPQIQPVLTFNQFRRANNITSY